MQLIVKEYQRDDTPWYIGYSGGKDSSALLVLTFNALLTLKEYHKPVTIVYCDTGVEIPTITDYVYQTLDHLEKESFKYNLPFIIKVAKPKLDDRYFVKVIGRGYPPPTNIFRWCTDRLRINPINTIIDKNRNAIVLLGVRNGESAERDKIISKHSTNVDYYLNQKTSSKVKIFSPVLNYTVKDIWSTIKFNPIPESINYKVIGTLYKDAGAECPVFRETKGTPCGKGRFGCWTCTVVRKDKSVDSMVKNGYDILEPLHNFRNWLIEFRDIKKYRCSYRRNGQIGLGPITLEGRRVILEKLLYAQEASGLDLISDEELAKIKNLWQIDYNNPKYIENTDVDFTAI